MFKSAMKVINEWLESVNSSNFEDTIALYDNDAILFPTFSNKHFSGRNQIKKYFEKLSKHDEVSVSIHDKTVKKQKLNNDVYNICGIYLWKFVVDGEILSFEARFSFVLNLQSSSPIVHHHSSQVPNNL